MHFGAATTRTCACGEGTAALSLGSVASLGLVAAYQYGLIRHLPG